MNIKDLPQGSYKTIGGNPSSGQGLNINSLPQGSYTTIAGNPQTTAQPQQSFSDKIWGMVANQAQSGIEQIKQGASQIENPQTDSIFGGAVKGFEGALSVGSGIASTITSPLAPLFAPISAGINAVADKVSDIPAVQKFAMSGAGQTTARVAQDLSNAGNIAGTILGVDQVAKGVPKIAEKTANTIGDMGQSMGQRFSGPSDDAIVSSYTKAVKPTMAGKVGPGQLDQYNQKVPVAVKAITANKDNLSFVGDTGDMETGKLPTSRMELADAVEQTKANIFKQYDTLAKQSGEQGATVPLDSAGQALDKVVNNEALQLANPNAVKYAQDIQSRLQNPDGTYKAVTPEVAQDVIKNMNATLKAFYRNPTYDTASRAAIDAGVVNQLRSSLDKAINESTGANYQALKNQYAALSAIEKDVNKAALAQMKQTGSNMSGFGKYVDIFSGGDMVNGLLTLNPGLFVKGAAQSAFSHLFQWWNSPDRAVSSMFKESSKGSTPQLPKK